MWAARPHLGSIFEKLLHRKNFILPAAYLRKTSRIRFGKAGAHPQLALEIAIAPETLYSHYNLSIFKAIAILCGSLLDFRFISLYSFICFANVGYSPTPRQHFCKIAAPKNFLFACGSFFETILLKIAM